MWQDLKLRIRIGFRPESQTAHVGTFGANGERGQFFGRVVASLPEPPVEGDWTQQKRWYAVLHRFDAEGRLLTTDHFFAGTTADGEDTVVALARTKLADWLAGIEGAEYQDIVIGLFRIRIDGREFGLVDASDPDEDYEAIHLVPDDLAFFPPWDGEYDT